MTTEELQASKGDYAYALAKAGVSQLPIVGAPIAEILPLIIAPPLEERRNEWLKSLGERLKTLEEKVAGFKLEDLQSNETFITTAMHASQAAIRNHQKEKLEALRNAVLNAALPNPPEEELQLIFLTYVDSLTPSHLTILKFLDEPKEWGTSHGITYPNWHMGSISSALEYAFSELHDKREIYDVYIRDLYSRGLTTTDSVHTTISGPSILASRTTAMGKQFLTFTSSPLE
jgi:hypothetical protein